MHLARSEPGVHLREVLALAVQALALAAPVLQQVDPAEVDAVAALEVGQVVVHEVDQRAELEPHVVDLGDRRELGVSHLLQIGPDPHELVVDVHAMLVRLHEVRAGAKRGLDLLEAEAATDIDRRVRCENVPLQDVWVDVGLLHGRQDVRRVLPERARRLLQPARAGVGYEGRKHDDNQDQEVDLVVVTGIV